MRDTRYFLLAAGLLLWSALAQGQVSQRANLVRPLGPPSLFFIENQGQVAGPARYYVRGRDRTVFVGDDALTVLLQPGSGTPFTLRLEFVGARAGAPLGGEGNGPVINLLTGSRDDWRTGLRSHSRLVYTDLWPGIDLALVGDTQHIKYELHVAPGADPRQIRLRYRGGSDLRIEPSGDLAIDTPLGTLRDPRPVSFQESSNGQRVEIGTRYTLSADEGGLFGFSLDRYDRTKALVIDPAIFVYASYLGGAGDERAGAVAVDRFGAAYLTGITNSTQASFPDGTGFGSIPGADTTHNGGYDSYVAKVLPSGAGLEYVTYIGGSGTDVAAGIAVDSAGAAYVAGYTNSGTGFPVLGGPSGSYHGGANDIFVFKLNSTGTGLLYSGFIGGDNDDREPAIAVDALGSAYVTGLTYSSQTTFPTGTGFGSLPGADQTHNGDADSFALKVSPDGASLEYASYIGGNAFDNGYAIGVDAARNVYVGGNTASNDGTFPDGNGVGAIPGPDTTYNGGEFDGFVVKLNATGTSFSYVAFVGGSGLDRYVPGLAVSAAGSAWLTGRTLSTESTFPTGGGFGSIPGFDQTHNGGFDAFVVKINAAGTAFDYATYIGGDGLDDTNVIAVDSDGNAYVAGGTTSMEFTFPDGDGFDNVSGPDTTHNGGNDAFVVKLDAAGTGLSYATYVGGPGYELGMGIAVDGAGNAYLAGATTSTGGFPDGDGFGSLAGFDQTYDGGSTDGFIVKISGDRLGGLTIFPASASILTGGQVTLTAAGCAPGYSAFSWVLLPSTAGGTLSSSSGRSVTYTAQAPGDAIIQVSADCAAAATATVHVRQGPAPEAVLALDPPITQGQGTVLVTATFSQPVDVAMLCVENEPSCPAMQVVTPSGGRLWTYALRVAPAPDGLDFGSHWLTARGRSLAGDWGPLSKKKELQVTQSKAVILLLHGYNPFGPCGPQPEDWWGWSDEPSIACQLAMRFFPDSTGPSSPCNHRPADVGADSNCTDAGPQQQVCVVNTLDGRADLDSPQCYEFYTSPPVSPPGPNCRQISLYSVDPPAQFTPRGLDLEHPPTGVNCTRLPDRWHCTVQDNLSRLESFVNSIHWLQSSDLILIGHSYGGQIARAYATRHSDRVKAVLTLDTPHLGSSLAQWKRPVNFFSGGAGCAYDGALHNFFGSDARQINEKYPPRASGKTEIFAASSERLIGGYDVVQSPQALSTPVAVLPSANGARGSGDDLAVQVSSQQGGEEGKDLRACVGGAGGARGCNFHTLTLYREVRSRLFPALHSDVINRACSWQGLYENDYDNGAGHGLKATLERLLPHPGPDCSACPSFGGPSQDPRCLALTSHARRESGGAAETDGGGDLVLQPAHPLVPIVSASGDLSPSATTASLAFTADAGTDLTVSVSSSNIDPELILSGPGAPSITAGSADGLSILYSADFALGTVTKTFLIREPAPGQWSLQIRVPETGGGPHLPADGASWQVAAAIRSPVVLALSLPQLSYLVGDSLNVAATLRKGDLALAGASVSAVVTPDTGETPVSLTLSDDGAHGDGASGDGIYAASTVLGNWTGGEIVIHATGDSGTGPFQRQASAHISVDPIRATIDGPFEESAPDDDSDGSYDSLGWSFVVSVASAGDYTVVGDLAAADGTVISNASSSLATSGAGGIQATLVFPGQDIYSSGRPGPYRLTNIQILLAASDGQHLVARGDQLATSTGPYWSWLNFQPQEAPSLRWISPAVRQVTAANTTTLQWKVQDGNGGTTIDLYYDTAGSGFNGMAVAVDLPVAHEAMTYPWDLSSLADGTYYVYARVRNGNYSNAVYGGSIVRRIDSDGDGMPDAWESAHSLNPNGPNDALQDPDGDRLANVDEYLNGTDPQAADTDGGGETDLSELVNGRDPIHAGDDVAGISISRFVPPQGDSRGGDTLLVIGSGFQSGATVDFGGVAAPEVTFVNSTRLVARTPAHTAGTVDVTVASPGGSGSAVQVGAFTFLCTVAAPSPPTATNSGPVCAGQDVQLTASPDVANGTFSWTGPGGFTSSSQSPVLPAAQPSASGTYSVTVSVNGCVSQAATTDVLVRSRPTAAVSGNQNICPEGSASVQAALTGEPPWTLQWSDGFSQSGLLASPATRSVSPAADTIYSITSVSDAHCSGTASGTATITVDGNCTSFHTVAPCRVVDTRGPAGDNGGPALAGGTARAFAFGGRCGIPVTAKAVSLNLTVTGATKPGYLTLLRPDDPLPVAAAISFGVGQTRTNNAITRLGAGGTLAIFAGQPAGGAVHVIVDVTGYFE